MGVDYLVTGAGGMIGRQMAYGHKMGRAELEITSSERVSEVFDQVEPKAVIHLAALNLQQCEGDPELAYRINVFGADVIARACASRGIRLIYVSTGAVFWGRFGQSFCESDAPSPRHIYGKTKLQAEQLIKSLVPNHLIVRTGWVFGGHGAHHRKFVDIILNSIATRQPVYAHEAQTGSPTFVHDFCQQLKHIADSPQIGTVHVVNSGIATPRDMAMTVLGKYGAEELLASQAGFNLGVDRSPSEALASSLFVMRPWQEALQHYLSEREALGKI